MSSENVQVPEIRLTERSDVRVTFEVVFYKVNLKDTNYLIEYFVGDSKRNLTQKQISSLNIVGEICNITITL